MYIYILIPPSVIPYSSIYTYVIVDTNVVFNRLIGHARRSRVILAKAVLFEYAYSAQCTVSKLNFDLTQYHFEGPRHPLQFQKIS